MNNNNYKRPVTAIQKERSKKQTNKRNGKIFKISYLVYVSVLVILIGMALLYVNSVLSEYENEHPQRHIEKAISLLKEEASSGELWKKEGAPSLENNDFETSSNPQKLYGDMLNGDIRISSPKMLNETDCVYGVLYDDLLIAEITLRKVGQPEQKLAIINIQKYELVSYLPVSHTYSIELPQGVLVNSELFISVNNINLTEDMAETKPTGENVFTFKNLILKPKIEIKDAKGNSANYKLPENANGKIEFDNTLYTLTLPNTIFVSVDGDRQTGNLLEDGRLEYKIRLAKKSDVELSDLYENKIKYTGTTTVPLSYYTFTTNEKCTVTVDGKVVPNEAVNTFANPEYEKITEYVPELPMLSEYKIVVLKDNAEVSVVDGEGKAVSYDKDKHTQDLVDVSSGTYYETVPEEVTSEVNVIKTLEDWSLFMTCDLNFYGVSKHLIKSSHLYNVALKYNNSIDRTFINVHYLENPPFVEESATNFIWLTDNCFAVDIHFVKKMILTDGRRQADEMNERCYFVKYDDTKDNVNNPKWKLVYMKEIVDDAK